MKGNCIFFSNHTSRDHNAEEDSFPGTLPVGQSQGLEAPPLKLKPVSNWHMKEDANHAQERLFSYHSILGHKPKIKFKQQQKAQQQKKPHLNNQNPLTLLSSIILSHTHNRDTKHPTQAVHSSSFPSPVPAPCKPLLHPQQTFPGPPSPTHKLRLTSMPPEPFQAPQAGQEASQTSRGLSRRPCWAIFPPAVRLPGLPAGVSSPKPRRLEERVAHVRARRCQQLPAAVPAGKSRGPGAATPLVIGKGRS